MNWRCVIIWAVEHYSVATGLVSLATTGRFGGNLDHLHVCDVVMYSQLQLRSVYIQLFIHGHPIYILCMRKSRNTEPNALSRYFVHKA